MNLTSNFTLLELVHSTTAIRNGINNNAPPDEVRNLTYLCQNVLEPILFISLIVVNSIDFDEPKGPYDPNKGIIEPVMSDSIPVEIKKPIKKKTKILTTQTLEQKKVEVVSTTPTLSNVIQKDSLPN